MKALCNWGLNDVDAILIKSNHFKSFIIKNSQFYVLYFLIDNDFIEIETSHKLDNLEMCHFVHLNTSLKKKK